MESKKTNTNNVTKKNDNYKTLIELEPEEAKKFLLEEKNYINFDLPDYFKFQPLLEKFYKQFTSLIDNKNLNDVLNSLKKVEGANYRLLSNKDGKYAWRPFELIHPFLYVSLVSKITEPVYWKEIKDRFKEFQKNKEIQCCSLPVVPNSKDKKEEETDETQKSAQIHKWWEKVEQQSLSLALNYRYMMQTDITDCYGSIYTHSIPWAIHKKKKAKVKRWDKDLIGNIIDNHLQCMNYGQTNGIPQGSILMDFIAEILLGYIDLELSKKIEKKKIENYKILRYRDDYRIFSNNSLDIETITKELSETLSEVGLRLNPTKPEFSDDIIKSAIKPDKNYWIANARITENKQKWLIQLYSLSERFPNSGTLDKQMVEFLHVIKKSKRKDSDIKTLVTLVVEIAFRNPRVIPTSILILTFLVKQIEAKEEKEKIIKSIQDKFDQRPNTSFLKIWLQRLSLKISDSIEYDEPLCKKVSSEYEKLSSLKDFLKKISPKIFKVPKDELLCKTVISGGKEYLLKDGIDNNDTDIWKTEKPKEESNSEKKDKITIQKIDEIKKIIKTTPIICYETLDGMKELPSEEEIKKITNNDKWYC